MNISRRTEEGRRDFAFGILGSVGLHALIVLIVLFVLVFDRPEKLEEEEEPEEMMEVVLEDPFEDDAPQPVATEFFDPFEEPPLEQEELVEEEEELVEEEEEEEPVEEEQEEEPFEEMELDRYAVEQLTNEEEPDEADHISDQANLVEEEMIAEVTTLEDVELTDEEHEAPELDVDTELEMAMAVPEELVEPDLFDAEREEEEPEPQEEIAEAEPEPAQEYRDPTEMFVELPDEEGPTPRELDRDRLFARDQAAVEDMLRDEWSEKTPVDPAPQGRKLLTRWRENEEALRASLENFLPHVQTGNHTSVNANAAPHASFLNRIHRSIHPRFALEFIPRIQNDFGNSDPINDMSLVTTVEIVIKADTGDVIETGIVSTSGNTLFDAEVLMISRSIARQPNAPSTIVSPDGHVYVHWTYWRDSRQCGSFGARIYRLQDERERRIMDTSWEGGE